MKKFARTAVAIAMIVSMPTAACTWRGGSAVDGARADPAAEDTVRGEAFNSALPSNVDSSLQRQVQIAQEDRSGR